MAALVRGALDAVIKIVEYCLDNKDLCLFQLWGTEGVEWRFYTDSDQSSNTEINNKCRSFIAMKGHTPIMFGSKVSSVKFGPDLDSFGVDHRGLSQTRCHSAMDDFHADVSLAAAEIYAASVGVNAMLHLGYVSDEMGFSFPQPIELCIDNTAAVVFSQGQTRRSKMRHIDAHQSWGEALHDDNIVKFKWVLTKDNLSDIGTELHPDLQAATRRAHGTQGYPSSKESSVTGQVGASLEARLCDNLRGWTVCLRPSREQVGDSLRPVGKQVGDKGRRHKTGPGGVHAVYGP